MIRWASFIAVMFIAATNAAAMCPKLLNGQAPQAGHFKRSNYRFFIKDQLEMDLVLGAYLRTGVIYEVIETYVVIAALDAVETKEEAEVRFYPKNVFDFKVMEVSPSRRELKLRDNEHRFELALKLKSPFDKGKELEIDRMSIKTDHEWVKHNVPTTMTKKDFRIGPEYQLEDLEFAFQGAAAELLSEVLPSPLDPQAEERRVTGEVERILKIINAVPYSRPVKLNVKYYRGLFIIEVTTGNRQDTYAFSINRTPLEMLDLASGLRNLNLLPNHPLLRRAERLREVTF